ncbi:hypothetical protein HY311_00735 [Candidatus Nomurabacteria bacterium]|nr:hypothetical protein [Candidatus Nomurabacteria bacterium]
MNTNKKIGFVVLGIIVLAGVFYGGMTYGGNNVRAAIMSRTGGAGNFAGRMGGARNASGFTIGQIISKDATSITVSMQTGGSKIIFLDKSTPITKQVAGALSDLAVGTDVSITGTANTDGSISATAVQIRPNMPQGARVQ